MVLSVIAVVAGGHAHIDAGGAIFLFVCGGLPGLVVPFIYNRGHRDAGGGDSG